MAKAKTFLEKEIFSTSKEDRKIILLIILIIILVASSWFAVAKPEILFKKKTEVKGAIKNVPQNSNSPSKEKKSSQNCANAISYYDCVMGIEQQPPQVIYEQVPVYVPQSNSSSDFWADYEADKRAKELNNTLEEQNEKNRQCFSKMLDGNRWNDYCY